MPPGRKRQVPTSEEIEAGKKNVGERSIGNQFWRLRSKHGRDKLFSSPAKMLKAAYEYFEWCDNNPLIKYEASKGKDNFGELCEIPLMRVYTLEGVCRYLNASRQYVDTLKSTILNKKDEDKTDEDRDFLVVIRAIEEIIREQKFSGATSGLFNALIISRDLGLFENVNNQTTMSGDMHVTPITVTVIPSDTPIAHDHTQAPEDTEEETD